MSKPKYKITEQLLDTPGSIDKLERDGFSRENISKSMYRLTEGACQDTRKEIMSKLYDRREQ